MRISDWSSDVCSSDLRSSNSLLEVGALSQTMIETDFSRLIEPTRINSRLYTDPAIFAGEMEKIWYRTWVYVGHESEVPEKNDYVTKSMGPTPIGRKSVGKGKRGAVRVCLGGRGSIRKKRKKI